MSTADAILRGARPDRLRRADVIHPFHGVIVTGERPRSVVDRAWAYTRVMPADGWFSHSTAARLLGLPLPRVLERGPLHVTVAGDSCRPRGVGVVGHQRDLSEPAWGTAHLRVSSGEHVPLRVATAGACLVTVASQVGLPDLVALTDAARLVADARATADIDRMLRHSSRRAGCAALRRALALSEPGVRSRAETHLRLTLARAGLPQAVVAPPTATPLGELHPDLAWPDFGVLVEYEGEGHRTNPRQFAADLGRFDAFGDAEWSTVRATKDDLYKDSRRLILTVSRRLRARGWRPTRPVRSDMPPIAVP